MRRGFVGGQATCLPSARVYDALLDPDLISQWRVPTGMSCHVHRFEAREGGVFRVSLTYDEPGAGGKTTAQTDTYHGRFEQLVPHQRVVESLEFESSDPRMHGVMRITTTLTAERGGTPSVPSTKTCRRACHRRITRRAGVSRWRSCASCSIRRRDDLAADNPGTTASRAHLESRDGHLAIAEHGVVTGEDVVGIVNEKRTLACGRIRQRTAMGRERSEILSAENPCCYLT